MENENPIEEAKLMQSIEANDKLETIGKNTEASILVQDETKEAIKDLQTPLDAIMLNTEPKEIQKVQLVSDEEKDDLAVQFFSMLKGKKGDKPTDEELTALIKPLIPSKSDLTAIIEPLIPEPIKGADGQDYVLTNEDKSEIASLIEVPIVEKVIEKTETIIEKPITIDKTKTVIKEVAKYEPAEQIAEKVNTLYKAIDFKVIKNFPDFKNNGGNGIGYIREASDVSISDVTVGQGLVWNGSAWVNGTVTGGASAFIDLTDVPNSYSGQAGKAVRVKATEDGLEFFSASGTGTVTSIATAGLISGGTITTTGTITTSMATNKLVGRGTAGTGVMEEITLGTGLSLSGTTLNATATITGSDTQVLFFDGANNPAGEAGMTYDKTNDALTVAGRIITPEIKAVGSAGVDIHNNSGTQVALFGAGGGTGTSLFSTTNIGSASADYIQITGGTGASTFTATGSSTDIDVTAVPKGAGKFKVTGNANISGLTASQIMATNASKDLVTLDTATYPSLTELTYVKGVTSAIQTQLNAKGTVSSVAQTFTGGLISVSGSPVTTTGTLALTVAGTSGGIPYFSSASTWASSAALAANALVIGGGAGVAPSTITTGTGVVTALGVNTGTAGAFVVNGGALGTPSSGTVTNLTGTASININGTVGATTPTTGAFTTISASSTLTASTTIELGHATDTTLSRVSAGVIAVEGVTIPTISSTSTLTNKIIQAGIIDYVIEPASDDTYEGESTDDKLAGDTIAQWDLVYLDSTSGRWEFADADSATTSGGVLLALAAAAGTDGNAMNVVFRGVVRNDGWTWTGAGKALYVSTTAGAMTETAPSGTDDVVRVVGYTLSDDCIYFNPSMDWATVV